MSDLISRADAISIVHSAIEAEIPFAIVADLIKGLPSADAEPTVIRSKTLMPTKDFKEWAKRIRETNPNAVVIPCDAEVLSADAVHGEWEDMEIQCNPYPPIFCVECSACGYRVGRETFLENTFNFCPNCGAKMKGGDSE